MTEKPATNPAPVAPTASAPEQPAPEANTPAQPTPAPTATASVPEAPASSGTPSASDERARISAILCHPEAQGREDLARSFAFDSDMSAEDAAKHLAAAPKQGAAQTLSSVMESEATELDTPPSADAATLRMADLAKARHAN